jgi:hypothetical protein
LHDLLSLHINLPSCSLYISATAFNLDLDASADGLTGSVQGGCAMQHKHTCNSLFLKTPTATGRCQLAVQAAAPLPSIICTMPLCLVFCQLKAGKQGTHAPRDATASSSWAAVCIDVPTQLGKQLVDPNVLLRNGGCHVECASDVCEHTDFLHALGIVRECKDALLVSSRLLDGAHSHLTHSYINGLDKGPLNASLP